MNGMSGMSISQDNNKIFQGIKISQWLAFCVKIYSIHCVIWDER